MGAGRGRYVHLDHTGDLGIDAEAPEECALYEVCARALFDILAGETCPVEPLHTVSVSVRAAERDLLLASWLRELLFLHDTERWLFSRFRVAADEEPGGGFRLHGEASGERFEAGRHSLETEVKAVTYHQLSVSRSPGGLWKARVIFDI